MSSGVRRAVGIGCLVLLAFVILLAEIGRHYQTSSPASSSSPAPTGAAPKPPSLATGVGTDAGSLGALRVVYAREPKIRVHRLPDERSEVMRQEPRKEALRVLKQQGEWFLLMRGGWVKASETASSSPEAEKEAKKLAVKQAKEKAIALAEGRRKIAAALRQRWLDQGVNIKVKVTGQYADRIILTYPLFDEVWANRFNKPDDLFWMLKMAGFNRVDLDNGFNYHMYWHLND